MDKLLSLFNLETHRSTGNFNSYLTLKAKKFSIKLTRVYVS